MKTVTTVPNRVRDLPSEVKKSTLLYFSVASLYAFSLALPHAALTPILLEKGLSFADITAIQIGYSFAIFLLEVPSGILSDIFPRKNVYLVSKILLSLFFILTYYSNGIVLIFLAWILYGISVALDSGTIGNDVILNIRDCLSSHHNKVTGFIEYLVRIDSRLESLFMLLGGAIGSILYYYVGLRLYWVAVAGSIICFLLIFHFFPKRKHASHTITPSNVRQEISQTVINGFIQLKTNSNIRTFLTVLALTQIFFQTHFQLWQGYFLSMGFSALYLGAFYAFFQVHSFLISFISLNSIIEYCSQKRIKPILIIVSLACIPGFFIASSYSIPVLATTTYLVFITIFILLLNHLNGFLRAQLDEKSLSTMTSFSSMASRLIAIITLSILSASLRYVEITLVVPIAFSVAIVICAFLLRFSKIQSKG